MYLILFCNFILLIDFDRIILYVRFFFTELRRFLENRRREQIWIGLWKIRETLMRYFPGPSLQSPGLRQHGFECKHFFIYIARRRERDFSRVLNEKITPTTPRVLWFFSVLVIVWEINSTRCDWIFITIEIFRKYALSLSVFNRLSVSEVFNSKYVFVICTRLESSEQCHS